jgi:hypothetical protein
MNTKPHITAKENRLPITTDVKTVTDADGVPVLLIIRERNQVLICESDNMNRNIRLTAATAPILVDILESFR